MLPLFRTLLGPPRWNARVQGSGLSTGGRLPDSRKPGPDGVGWGGKGPGEASWTMAQCGDCLSAQALGHAATPPWARAPALGFQRDVTGGDWLSLSIVGSLPHQLLQSPPPPQAALSPHSFPAPKCPSNSFSVSAMNPGSLSHCAIPTTAASHLGGEGGGCAATLHPSAPCLSMLWTMMLQHGSLGAVKTLASTLGLQAPLPLYSPCPPHAHTDAHHLI